MDIDISAFEIDKKKIVKYIVGCIAFTLLGLWVFVVSDTNERYSAYVLLAIATIVIAYTGLLMSRFSERGAKSSTVALMYASIIVMIAGLISIPLIFGVKGAGALAITFGVLGVFTLLIAIRMRTIIKIPNSSSIKVFANLMTGWVVVDIQDIKEVHYQEVAGQAYAELALTNTQKYASQKSGLAGKTMQTNSDLTGASLTVNLNFARDPQRAVAELSKLVNPKLSSAS